jgi:DNA repair exonuclease SbcCD nuclease subunit
MRMQMRIAHMADTHLGFSAYRKVDEATGLNQREVDLYDAFQRAVDEVIRRKVDGLVHAGDLFDSVRPSNRAISFAMEQLRRLHEAGIETVVIAGNHSTPRLRETGSVFRILEHLPGVKAVYRGRLETVELADGVVHAVPHGEAEEMQREMLAAVPEKGRAFNLMTVHSGFVGLASFGGGEFNETMLPTSLLDNAMDYNALGHYHRHVDLDGRSAYSGSIERLTFGEAGEEKGIVIADMGKMRREFVPLPCRPMIDLPALHAKGISAVELQRQASDLLRQAPAGALVRLTLRQLSAAQYRALDIAALRQEAASAMHLELRFETEEQAISKGSGLSIGPLEREFSSFLDRFPTGGADKDRLRALAAKYLERREES